MAHPPRFDEDDQYLARVRALASALPGAAEKISHGHPAFFTKKVFDLGPDTDWDEVAELLDGSFRLTAPRRNVAELDARS